MRRIASLLALLMGSFALLVALPATAFAASGGDPTPTPSATPTPSPLATPSPGASVSTLTHELNQDMSRLNAIDSQLESEQATLATENVKLAKDSKRQAELRGELSSLARLDYQEPMLDMGSVLEARNLEELLGDVSESRLVAGRQQDLLTQAATLQRQDQAARDSETKQLDDMQAEQTQAKTIAAKTSQMRDNAIAAQVAARAAAAAAQTTTASTIMPGGATPPSGAWPNRFYTGECTWWVADHVYIPWLGNAIQWWAAAQPYYPEGQTPKVGAIMVSEESSYGHVAIVIGVSGNSFTVSEMNYDGWDEVDQRTITLGSIPLEGFIYPPAQDEHLP
ncbi:MAG TPA: CHAP domain-containing protein [Candidatus Dormibacteraeota bacterium]|jgi:surface antigen|nr:CHAP domain-containing protein [Candidatus Dormibacteraeota bacterium]